MIVQRILTTIAAALCIALTARGADGSPAYNFLNIAPSPKIYALGGVNISAVDADLLATEQNPALLGQEYNNRLGISYMRYIADSNLASIAYAHSAGSRGAWSASVRYFGYGSIDRTDVSGNTTGTFSPKDLAIGAMYSHDITDMLRGGIAIKGLYSSYDSYSAFALATGIGINYYDPDRDLSLSAAVVNLGGQIKRFDNSYDRLPIDVRLGWTQSFPGLPIRFSITAWNLTKWNLPYYETGDGSDDSKPRLKSGFGSNLFRHLVFAADLVPSEKYYICLGYNYKTRTDMSTYSRNFLSGFSLGAGLDIGGWGVGLAFAQPHSGATTFMVSLSADFDKLIRN